jgi:hypothetical protein
VAGCLIKHRDKYIFVVLISLFAPRYLGYALVTEFFSGRGTARIWVCLGFSSCVNEPNLLDLTCLNALPSYP